jgi:hypothetical protein
MVTFEIQTVTVNGPATGRGLNLEMETLPRRGCVQEHIKIQEFWLNIYRFAPFLQFDKSSGLVCNEHVRV